MWRLRNLAFLFLFQSPGPLPVRPEATVGKLFEDLGRCHASLSTEQEYNQSLIRKILEQQKEIDSLKNTASEK